MGIKKWLSMTVALSFCGSLAVMSLFQNCAPPKMGEFASEVQEDDVQALAIVDGTTKLPGHDGASTGHQFLDRKAQLTVYNTPLMNKHQMLSQLEYIFGPTLGETQAIEATFATYYAEFGGACSIYDSINIINPVTMGIVAGSPLIQRCNGTMLMNTPSYPPLGATRLALTDKICSRAVQTLDPVSYALKRIDSRVNSLYLPSIDEALDSKGAVVASRNFGLMMAFRLFYPTQPDPRSASPAVLESMRVFFANPQAPKIEEWQNALYTLCISPYWQVL